jgi:hypothetical protein
VLGSPVTMKKNKETEAELKPGRPCQNGGIQEE